eukprot:205174_1
MCRFALCFIGLAHFVSVVSVDTAYFTTFNVSQTLICPENKACDIACTASSSCATLNVDARNAVNLNIACDGTSSCSTINVTGPNISIAPSANISISCNGVSSCNAAKYRLSNTYNVDINCMGERACYFADFYLYNASTISAICHNLAGTTSSSYAACRSTDFFADDSTSFYSECYENDCNSANYYVRNGHNATINLLEASTGKDATIYAADLDGTINIHCSAYMACYRFTIESETMTGDLNVYCTGADNSMCNAINVHGADMTGDLYFVCDSDVPQGCATANIYCPHTETAKCSVYCSGRQGNECQNADVYVMGPEYVNNGVLDLTCEGESSCSYLDIKCSYNPSNVFDSLYTKPVYNYYDNFWTCDDYQCGCPWANNANDNILCDAFVGSDCNVNCVNITNGGCEGIAINASLSTNLYLNCEPNTALYHDGCEGSAIICPQDVDNAICDITCIDNGCESVTILAPNGNNAQFSMHCQDTASCEYATIQSDAVDLDIELQCTALRSCRYMKANLSSVNTANISCTDENSCWELEMNLFSGPNMMNFQCGSSGNNQSSYSCRDSIIKAVDVPIDSTWNQYCLDGASCSGMYLDIISPVGSNLELSLQCLSAESCFNVVFAAPNGNHASVDCTGTYSCGHGTAPTWRLGWDFSNFSSVDITCNSSSVSKNEAACNADMALTNVGTVNLYCDQFDCAQHTFSMSNAGDITINCDGEQSCYLSKFFASSSDLFRLSCTGQEACRAVDITCPYTQQDACQLTCSDDYRSCYWFDVTVDDLYQYNYLNLQCNGMSSCTDLNFRCSGPKQDTLYSYDSAASAWGCADDACCPFKEELIGICQDNTDCTVSCVPGQTDCAGKIIDARNAASLSMYCEDCASSVIYCPLMNGKCDIECATTRSCDNTNIYYLDDVSYIDHHLSLNCSDATESCYYTTLYANKAGNIHFQSMASLGVTLYGSNARSMVIMCIGDSMNDVNGCNALKVYGESVSDQADVYCGDSGCVSAQFHFETANNINVLVSGDNAFYYSTVYASNASSLSVSCSYNSGSSCNNAYLYYPKTNGFLNCYGRGCYALTVYAIIDMNDITFSLNTCNECDSLADCFGSNWQIKCGYDTFSNSVSFYRNRCATDYSGCDCNSMVQTFNNTMYAEDHEHCYTWITTTMTPTINPSMNPTSIPTITPTMESMSPTTSPTSDDIVVASTRQNTDIVATDPQSSFAHDSRPLIFSFAVVLCSGVFVLCA